MYGEMMRSFVLDPRCMIRAIQRLDRCVGAVVCTSTWRANVASRSRMLCAVHKGPSNVWNLHVPVSAPFPTQSFSSAMQSRLLFLQMQSQIVSCRVNHIPLFSFSASLQAYSTCPSYSSCHCSRMPVLNVNKIPRSQTSWWK